MNNRKNQNRGFTLVELIICIAIIIIAAAILVPKYLDYVEDAQAIKDVERAQRWGKAIEAQVADDFAQTEEEKKQITLPIPTNYWNAKDPGNIDWQYTYKDQKTCKTIEKLTGIPVEGVSNFKTELGVKTRMGSYSNYQFRLYVSEQGEVRITVWGQDRYRDSTTKKWVVARDEYELYPSVEKGCPWDVEGRKGK